MLLFLLFFLTLPEAGTKKLQQDSVCRGCITSDSRTDSTYFSTLTIHNIFIISCKGAWLVLTPMEYRDIPVLYRFRPLAHLDSGGPWFMVHAVVVPSWTGRFLVVPGGIPFQILYYLDQWWWTYCMRATAGTQSPLCGHASHKLPDRYPPAAELGVGVVS